MNVTLPNGVTIKGIPEGTTKQQIMQKAISSGISTENDFNIKSGRELLEQSTGVNVAPQPEPQPAPQETQQKMQHPAEDPAQPQYQGSWTDIFTGEGGEAESTKHLPELYESGILSGLDVNKAEVAAKIPALLTATDPNELASIAQSISPQLAITYEKAPNGSVYPVLRNNVTGVATPINRAGLSGQDLLQGGAIAAAFTPAGRTTQGLGLAAKAAKVGAKSGLTSAAIEASQSASGGEFNPENVAIDTLLGGLFEPAAAIAKKTGVSVRDAFVELAKRSGLTSDEVIKAGRYFDSQGFRTHYSKSRQDLYQSAVPTTEEGVKRSLAAQERGIQLSQPQATRNFRDAEAEQTLLRSDSPQGEQVRSFMDTQQDQVKKAVEDELQKYGGSSRYTQATGAEPEQSVSSMNELVRDALTEGKKLSSKQVKKLYEQAAEIEGPSVPLNNESILNKADEAIVAMPTTPEVKKQIEYALAKFGLIGENQGKKGRFTSVIDDDGNTIKILGDVEPLSLNNAEDFRKALNVAVRADVTGAAKEIVNTLDQTVNDIPLIFLDPARKEAYETARGAASQKAKTFKANDIVQKLTSYKPNSRTPQVTTQDVINNIVKGKGSLDNTKSVIRALNRYPSNKAGEARKALGAESLGDIFAQSISKDSGDISGARLNSAIKKYDPETLKLILGAEGYKSLKQLQSVIGDATIPVSGTVNNSGTAYRVFNMLEKLGNAAGLGQANFGTLIKTGVAKGKELKRRNDVLKRTTQNNIRAATEEQQGNRLSRSAVRFLSRIGHSIDSRQSNQDNKQ